MVLRLVVSVQYRLSKGVTVTGRSDLYHVHVVVGKVGSTSSIVGIRTGNGSAISAIIYLGGVYTLRPYCSGMIFPIHPISGTRSPALYRTVIPARIIVGYILVENPTVVICPPVSLTTSAILTPVIIIITISSFTVCTPIPVVAVWVFDCVRLGIGITSVSPLCNSIPEILP